MTKSLFSAILSGLSKNGILGMKRDKLSFTKRNLPPYESAVLLRTVLLCGGKEVRRLAWERAGEKKEKETKFREMRRGEYR